jgi:hypothetical protein
MVPVTFKSHNSENEDKPALDVNLPLAKLFEEVVVKIYSIQN